MPLNLKKEVKGRTRVSHEMNPGYPEKYENEKLNDLPAKVGRTPRFALFSCVLDLPEGFEDFIGR